MRGPSFLPDELIKDCEVSEGEKELFQLLIQKPKQLVLFFETACSDETWSESHLMLMRKLFRWSAKMYYLGRLPINLAQRVTQSVQRHYSILHPLLYFRPAPFFNITVFIEKQAITVNSLLFGSCSLFFSQIFAQSFNSFKDSISIPKASLTIFRLVEEYVLKGQIAELWRQDYTTILELMRQAKKWRLPDLVKECAELLYRYFDRDHVIEMILQAHQEFFLEWKHDGYRFFNELHYGLRFLEARPENLKVEFLNFKQETIELFKLVAPKVTHLAFSGNLSENPAFGKVILASPKLIGVDLRGSTDYAKQDEKLPFDLFELDLSACPWLNPQNFKEFVLQCSDLKRLNLSNNFQLNYLSWGLLYEIDQLTALELVGCHQMKDEDLKLISRTCPKLIELHVEECQLLSDEGILELLQNCHGLSILNISRCYALTDRTLSNLALYATSLTYLDIERCSAFSEKALLNFLQRRPGLHGLNVRQCSFSLQTLLRIRETYPFLNLID